MTGDGDGDPYYAAIEAAFVRRRGAPLLLSPRDWSLIGEWKDAGIRLEIVLQAIDNVFDAFARRATPAGRRINSLSYCRQEVLSLHDLALALHAMEAGRPDPASPGGGQTAARYLGRLARRVREAMTRASQAGHDPLVACMARVLAEIRTMARDLKSGAADASALEERLRTLDAEVLRAGRAVLGNDRVSDLERGLEQSLDDAAIRMTPETRARTRSATLDRRIRDETGAPRLTLFD